MPKESKYIVNKSNVLFDMHRQLADIKAGKAYKEGDTAVVRRRPTGRGGLASTGLLSIVLAWNEAFWSVLLTTTKAAPLTTFIAGYTAPEGLFWAKVSAASTLAVAPIVVFGWLTQRQLVQGLTFGAVK